MVKPRTEMPPVTATATWMPQIGTVSSLPRRVSLDSPLAAPRAPLLPRTALPSLGCPASILPCRALRAPLPSSAPLARAPRCRERLFTHLLQSTPSSPPGPQDPGPGRQASLTTHPLAGVQDAHRLWGASQLGSSRADPGHTPIWEAGVSPTPLHALPDFPSQALTPTGHGFPPRGSSGSPRAPGAGTACRTRTPGGQGPCSPHVVAPPPRTSPALPLRVRSTGSSAEARGRTGGGGGLRT